MQPNGFGHEYKHRLYTPAMATMATATTPSFYKSVDVASLTASPTQEQWNSDTLQSQFFVRFVCQITATLGWQPQNDSSNMFQSLVSSSPALHSAASSSRIRIEAHRPRSNWTRWATTKCIERSQRRSWDGGKKKTNHWCGWGWSEWWKTIYTHQSLYIFRNIPDML